MLPRHGHPGGAADEGPEAKPADTPVVAAAPGRRPDVSVVVIVYNDADRLPAAVNSIRDQTLRNLEILIVNDASTDDTAAVADELATLDPRIRTIHLPENSGGC